MNTDKRRSKAKVVSAFIGVHLRPILGLLGLGCSAAASAQSQPSQPGILLSGDRPNVSFRSMLDTKLEETKLFLTYIAPYGQSYTIKPERVE
jgi:hypothetical protein